jgi:hypothetical protein
MFVSPLPKNRRFHREKLWVKSKAKLVVLQYQEISIKEAKKRALIPERSFAVTLCSFLAVRLPHFYMASTRL